LPFDVPALFSTAAQRAPCQASENSDSKAYTLFTKIFGLPHYLASYSILALRASFSSLSHCGLRKCKLLLLVDQAKYSQQGKSVIKGVAYTSDLAGTQGPYGASRTDLG